MCEERQKTYLNAATHSLSTSPISCGPNFLFLRWWWCSTFGERRYRPSYLFFVYIMTSKQVSCTTCTNNQSFFFFNLILFTFGCAGSLMLHAGFLQLQRAVATFHCGVQASHCSGFSCCRAQTLHTRSSVVVAYRLQSTGSMLQHMSSFAPQHVGCS